jgi:hypothetical protein
VRRCWGCPLVPGAGPTPQCLAPTREQTAQPGEPDQQICVCNHLDCLPPSRSLAACITSRPGHATAMAGARPAAGSASCCSKRTLGRRCTTEDLMAVEAPFLSLGSASRAFPPPGWAPTPQPLHRWSVHTVRRRAPRPPAACPLGSEGPACAPQCTLGRPLGSGCWRRGAAERVWDAHGQASVTDRRPPVRRTRPRTEAPDAIKPTAAWACVFVEGRQSLTGPGEGCAPNTSSKTFQGSSRAGAACRRVRAPLIGSRAAAGGLSKHVQCQRTRDRSGVHSFQAAGPPQATQQQRP